jgi:hypothetical protein
VGPAQARVATAHKRARTGSHRLKERAPSSDIGATAYYPRFRARQLQYVQKKAAKLGDKLSLAD